MSDLPPVLAVQNGTYTIRQKSSGRFLDAYENAGNDFRLVTRPAQDNDTQVWEVVGPTWAWSGPFARKATAATSMPTRTKPTISVSSRVRRKTTTPSAGCFLRTAPGETRFQQLSNFRFMDAHEVAADDFRLVTRPAQNNDTQRWILDSGGPARFRLRQKSSTRRMDAHENAANDFSVVTRPAQDNDTQVWIRQFVGTVANIRQKSSGRFMDAHEDDNNDFAAVTRPAQNNDSQLWIVVATGDGSHTMRQLRNGRFLDAHELEANDFGVVTRTAQDNDTQRWLFDFVG